jgi:hypothetical protein
MKLVFRPGQRERERGSALIAYLIFALIIMGTIATLASYVIQNVQLGRRRVDMVNAYQFAQGGAAIAGQNVETAFLTNNGAFLSNLTTTACGSWAQDTTNSTSSLLVYRRTLTSPFTNQEVSVQLRMTNSSPPPEIKVLATAVVGRSSQTVEATLKLAFGTGAAILSTAQGSVTTGTSKSTGQAGNVCIDGNGANAMVVAGGIRANGSANVVKANVDSLSDQLYGTDDQIPDYTNPGADVQLFDFGRFVACAKASGNYFSNLVTFANAAATSSFQGVVAVDIPYNASTTGFDAKSIPNGINVKGTLCFRFVADAKGQNWGPLQKVINDVPMYINPANLSGLVSTNASTHASGYPPVYTNPAKNPFLMNITNQGYANFVATEDLPALMYNNAILDIHGPVNICGAVYSPSFMEIENKSSGATQYFRGMIIVGGGVYLDSGGSTYTIVSYDPASVDQLATAGTRGKTVKLVYQK